MPGRQRERDLLPRSAGWICGRWLSRWLACLVCMVAWAPGVDVAATAAVPGAAEFFVVAGWDGTRGFPGEGPAFTGVRLDEASDGTLTALSRCGPLAGPDSGLPTLPDAVGQGGHYAAAEPRQMQRGRGPRPRLAARTWSLVTANATSWTRADELLTEAAQRARKPDVVLTQELARAAVAIPGIRSQLAHRRLQAAFQPSVTTQAGGLSAGVGVVARLSAVLATIEAEDIAKKHRSLPVLLLVRCFGSWVAGGVGVRVHRRSR